MAQQARAIRTRRIILDSAAAVFAERGYERATIGEILARAGVTKGALYFHFASKEELALGVLSAQLLDEPLTPQDVKLQELVDQGFLLAHRLQTDSLVQASVALALDSGATSVDRAAPFQAWVDQVAEALTVAKARGEILPHVKVLDTAELFSGAFAGIQTMSQVVCDRNDLTHRVVVLLQHVLPSISTPAVLTGLDMSQERAKRLAAEYEESRRRHEDADSLDAER
ncbi:ScbR family autoregulator-binding transcription factor [Streptomyces hydrogenans]|uniref:ScbR family autoregulator-binding transcription factor n=1 Tax=Streptomyces hydrogenans TaxID=1873719 RepID=UPI0035E054A9